METPNFQRSSFMRHAPLTLGALASLVAGSYFFGGGCGSDAPLSDGYFGATRQSSMALSVQVDPDLDVDGMSFQITRHACAPGESFEPLTYTHSGSLEELTFPADLVPDQPYHPDSEHQFADHYVVLPAGCYSVQATPTFQGAPASICTASNVADVRVEDGRTTEVTLVSQCQGAKTGGLDAAAVFNRPPAIVGVVYTPSKFVALCQPTEICVTATDPDNDPMEFVLTQDGQPITSPMTSKDMGEGQTRCVQLAPDHTGAYSFEARVYDLLDDPDNGQIRFEDYFAQLGEPHDSHDSLTFPLYVQDDSRYTCQPASPDMAGQPDMSGSSDLGNPGGGGGSVDMGNPGGGSADMGNPNGSSDMGNSSQDMENPGNSMDMGNPGGGNSDMGNPGGGDDMGTPTCQDLTTAELRQQINCTVNAGVATFTIPQGACPEQLSFSSYELPTGQIHPFDAQILLDNITATYAPGTYTLTVDVPAVCGYQTDLYTGAELANLDPMHGHGGRILCYDVSEDDTCQGTTECSTCSVQGTQDTTVNSHAQVTVEFTCNSSVDVTASKDLSNVVLGYADGTTQKFDNLNIGHSGTFSGTGNHLGKTIARVWVKAGSFKSGDGPGYGERIESCQQQN